MKNEHRKIALITGGSRGLGKDSALRLAQRGVDVILTYRKEAGAGANTKQAIEAQGRRAEILQLDLSEMKGFATFTDEVTRLLKSTWETKQFDFLINNAGIGGHAMIGGTPEALFDQLMNVHLKGTFFLTQALMPLLRDGGGIVNMSTGLTRFAIPGYAAYASMKGGVETFTKYLAQELGPRGIRANVVAPGAIDNDFNAATFNHRPEIKKMLADETALGRVGRSDDIGGVVAFLCSDDAKWITAQRLEASGGMVL